MINDNLPSSAEIRLGQMHAQIQSIACDAVIAIDAWVDTEAPEDCEALELVKTTHAKLERIHDIAESGRPEEGWLSNGEEAPPQTPADRLLGQASIVVDDWRAGEEIGDAVEQLGNVLDEINRKRRAD